MLDLLVLLEPLLVIAFVFAVVVAAAWWIAKVLSDYYESEDL